MAWMTSHLFVHCDEAAAVADALVDLLARTDHRADHEGILDPPAPLLVSPPHEGWVAVTGARAWLESLPWAARELSRLQSAHAVSCELIGNSYSLRLGEFSDGQEQRLLCSPEHAWAGATDEVAAMPMYEDMERQTYVLLTGLGIPPSLVTIGAAPLGFDHLPALGLGTGIVLGPHSDGPAARSGTEVQVRPFSGGDPPVVPTGTTSDFGLMLFDERYVEGKPTRAALDRLLEIEEALLARAKRAVPEADVTLTVTYHGGLHEGLMDEMLRARGRPTAAHVERGDRRPWWQFWRHLGRVG
jgi:hypothetical protein